MINCYLLDGEFHEKGVHLEGFTKIEAILKDNQELLHEIPVQAIVTMLDRWSKIIAGNKDILKKEGSAYLSFFLKENNIEKLIKCSVGDKTCLESFTSTAGGKLMKAQPRGLVCHWIAGNIRTLAVYSMLQAALGRNSSLLRIPEDNILDVLELIGLLGNIEVSHEGKIYNSNDLIKNISVVCFDSHDRKLNAEMSLLADARVIWGGQEAVDSINLLPKKTTCRDVVFGPKYSFAVIDKTLASMAEHTQAAETLGIHKSQYTLNNYVAAFAQDIIQFEQKACSSPHVLFVEGTRQQAETIGEMLSIALSKAAKRYPNIVSQAVASRIINERGRYELELQRRCIASRDLSWSILVDGQLSLKEPLGGRCIYIKYIDDIFNIQKLITKKIQTVGLATLDKKRAASFADIISRRGVDRITALGAMNIYDYPWDGNYLLGELVRWCSLNI